jgi:hypothetical protein
MLSVLFIEWSVTFLDAAIQETACKPNTLTTPQRILIFEAKSHQCKRLIDQDK